MQLLDITQYHEAKLHGRADLPYNTYLCTIPLDFSHVPLHWHEDMEIIYIKKGYGSVCVDMQRYEVTQGCLVFVPPGHLHSIEGSAGHTMEYENIIFSLSMLETADEDWCTQRCIAPLRKGSASLPVLLRPQDAHYSEVAACVDAADALCAACPAGYPLLLKSHLYALFFALWQSGKTAAQGAKAAATDKIKQVLRFVEQHYASPISVAEMARLCCFSPSHFMKFFKAATGRGFIEYCNDFRLVMAARALTQSAQPVLNIAASVGFDSPSYFNRCFKKKYGVSPRAYRAQHTG